MSFLDKARLEFNFQIKQSWVFLSPVQARSHVYFINEERDTMINVRIYTEGSSLSEIISDAGEMISQQIAKFNRKLL